MPSVDYSQQSNEANLLSTTEKVVGQWTNGKLLYQKVVTFGTLSAGGTNNVAHDVSNIENALFVKGFCTNPSGEYVPIVKTYFGDLSWTVAIGFISSTNIAIQVGSSYSGVNALTGGVAIIQYTKTTDSPLASDVKFAGVLSDGTVVYKKTVATGGSAPSGTTLIYRLALLNNTDVVYFAR
jgi:hypothetical protein